jgi:hypothetical protein
VGTQRAAVSNARNGHGQPVEQLPRWRKTYARTEGEPKVLREVGLAAQVRRRLVLRRTGQAQSPAGEQTRRRYCGGQAMSAHTG